MTFTVRVCQGFACLTPTKRLANLEGLVKKPARTTAKKAPAAPDGLITTDADLRDGVKALRRKCAHMRTAHDLAGHPPLRRRPGGFDGIVRIINGQQLSVASAAAIYGRVAATIQPLTAKRLLAASDETLRGCGLSRPKIKTLRAVASAVVAGLDLDGLATLPEAEAIAQLTAVSGIGPWTADIYLMFCVGRRDVFASGDLALQIAAQMVMGLEARPTAREMAEIAERWSPWRTVAAGLLWAYYAEAKKKGLAVPV
jgi:DNA-3-methyladenine glycosylase II